MVKHKLALCVCVFVHARTPAQELMDIYKQGKQWGGTALRFPEGVGGGQEYEKRGKRTVEREI